MLATHILRVAADSLDLLGELEHDRLVGRSRARAGRVLVCLVSQVGDRQTHAA